MLKTVKLCGHYTDFDLRVEQPQIRYALALDWGPAPEGMEPKHWLLETEWRQAMPDGGHDFDRNDELETLLVL